MLSAWGLETTSTKIENRHPAVLIAVDDDSIEGMFWAQTIPLCEHTAVCDRQR